MALGPPSPNSSGRRLLWPALTTVPLLALGLGLGVWQLQRLAWKQDLLAQIDRGEAEGPVPLGPSPVAFRRVVVQGHFMPQVARYGAEVRSTRAGTAMGSHVLVPLQRDGADPVMVDRGWAPETFDQPAPSGPVSVVGYVRPAEAPVRFGAADDPAARRFYALDPAAIGASLGLPRVAAFTVVALGAPGTLPEPAASLPRPPNNHLSYALTWFALSLGLAVVFSLYARQVFRAPSS